MVAISADRRGAASRGCGCARVRARSSVARGAAAAGGLCCAHARDLDRARARGPSRAPDRAPGRDPDRARGLERRAPGRDRARRAPDRDRGRGRRVAAATSRGGALAPARADSARLVRG